MPKKITKIKDKLKKVGDSFTVSMYDNGFMFEINGRNSDDEWSSVKILCNSLEDLNTLIVEASDMERD